MTSLIKCSGILAVAIPFMAATLLAQKGKQLTGQIELRGTCGTCTMVAEGGASIGGTSDEHLFPDGATVMRGKDGTLYVGSDASGEPILRYSPNGKFQGTLGRIGDGPGEYRDVRSIALGHGDSLVILGSNVLAVISTKTGAGRTVRLTGVPVQSFLGMQSGEFVVNGSYPKHTAFTVISPSFAIARAFGPTPLVGQSDLRKNDSPVYRMAQGTGNSFWAVKREFVQRVERWSILGELLQRLDSTPPWFPPYNFEEQMPEPTYKYLYTRRPFPFTAAAGKLPGGRLLILTTVADPGWKPLTNVPAFKTYREALAFEPPKEWDRHLDTVAELYDEASGKRMGAWRFHERFRQLLDDGLTYTRTQQADGNSTVRLWRLRLEMH